LRAATLVIKFFRSGWNNFFIYLQAVKIAIKKYMANIMS